MRCKRVAYRSRSSAGKRFLRLALNTQPEPAWDTSATNATERHSRAAPSAALSSSKATRNFPASSVVPCEVRTRPLDRPASVETIRPVAADPWPSSRDRGARPGSDQLDAEQDDGHPAVD